MFEIHLTLSIAEIIFFCHKQVKIFFLIEKSITKRNQRKY